MSKDVLWRFGAVSAFALSAAITAAPSVTAQEDDEADSRRLQTVTVSATKRDETLQDVPVSVGAVPAETIAKIGAVDIADISAYIPNFQINNASILPNLYVRGLGSGATHSIEQSVGRFVDEVYIGRGAMNLHGLFDVASVEVLRGPQGTLFGKNTAAGALIIRTGEPTADFDAGVTFTHGTYSTQGDFQEVQGFVSGPLTDTLRGRLSARFRADDGFYINRLGDDVGPAGPEREYEDIRLKLEWDATENTTVGLRLENRQYDAVGSDAAEFLGGPPPVLANVLNFSPNFNTDADWIVDIDCTDQFTDVNGDGVLDAAPFLAGGENFGSFCPGREQETSSGSLRIDHEFPGAGTLTLLTAYQEYDYEHRFFGIDMGVANSFRANRLEEYESTTAELRYTSELINDKFDFIVGAYVEDSDISRNQFSDINLLALLGAPIILQRNEPWTQSTETFAAFAQVRYDISDQLRVILGGRFSDESKDFAFERFFNQYGSATQPLPATSPTGPFGVPVLESASRSEDKFTPAITLQYKPSETLNLYATYAQGHKTGGFSDRIDQPGSDFEFDNEVNDTFEIGAKAQWFDGRLSTNVTVFTMDIEGLQLATQVPGNVPAFSVDNAAQVTSQGIEFDAQLLVGDNWTLGADFAYLDATYDEFSGTPDCPDSARVNGVCDLSGFPLIFAPETKGTVFAEYFNPTAFGGWGFGARVDANYSDEYFTDIAYGDTSFEDGYTLFNGNLRLVSPDERYTLSLIGRNLTEEKVIAWGIPSGPNVLGSLRKPREVSVKLAVRY